MMMCVRIRAFAHGAIRHRQAMIHYQVDADVCDLDQSVFTVTKIRRKRNEKWIATFSDLLTRKFIK
jgi:hypothetical protein